MGTLSVGVYSMLERLVEPLLSDVVDRVFPRDPRENYTFFRCPVIEIDQEQGDALLTFLQQENTRMGRLQLVN